jgi:hypothetical protein
MAPRRYVSKLRPSETNSLKGLWRVGVFTKEQMKEHFKISDVRLKQMENTRFIKIYEEKIYIDKKGIKECEKLGMAHRYSSNFKNFEHDHKLSRVYLSFSDNGRENWITEKELQEVASGRPEYNDFKNRMIEAHDKGKFQATPDAAYLTERGVIAIEITTNNYSNQDIEQKVEFSREFLDGIHVY